MRVSVAMCTFNGAEYLQEQLDSIAAQTLAPAELVVCDDGSSDATMEIVSKFTSQAPFNVEFHRNEARLGSSKNFEKALRLCHGDVIALADQDDVWHVNKLESMVPLFEQDRDLGGAVSDGELIDENGNALRRKLWDGFRYRAGGVKNPLTPDILLRGEMVTGAALLVRAACRDLFLPVGSRWVHDAWIAWMLTLYSKIVSTPKALIRYRVHSQQQLGVPRHSLMERILRARLDRELLQRDVARFDELQRFVAEHPSTKYPEIESELAHKVRHCELRAVLPTNHWKRILPVARAFPLYRRFTFGFLTAMKDVVA